MLEWSGFHILTELHFVIFYFNLFLSQLFSFFLFLPSHNEATKVPVAAIICYQHTVPAQPLVSCPRPNGTGPCCESIVRMTTSCFEKAGIGFWPDTSSGRFCVKYLSVPHSIENRTETNRKEEKKGSSNPRI